MANIVTNSKNYTDIANAIRGKNGTSTKYKPSEMALAIRAIEGGGIPCTLTVETEAGALVTATLGNTTVSATANSNGIATLILKKEGAWTITATSNGETKSTTVNVYHEIAEEIELLSADPVLENNSWETISKVAQKGEAANYWSVGDTKAVVLNGTIESITISNATYYAFIFGINHNSTYEGNGIHFSFKASNGRDIMFYSLTMNASSTNAGGWSASQMRNTYCSALLACLPSDLREVISNCTKYTDNTGGTSNTASYVTATSDKIFIPAEFEVFGARTNANSAEQSYQKQYDYYKAGNSKKRYHHANTSVSLDWWLRSPAKINTGNFVKCTSAEKSDYAGANGKIGFAACFKV